MPQPAVPHDELAAPDASDPGLRGPVVTERAIVREREEREYTPVIIKRVDVSRRHADDILEHAIEAGLEQLKRPLKSLVLSAVAAGFLLSFSAMAVAVVWQLLAPYGPIAQRLGAAAVYPLGFVVCIMGGSELFTEHTATAVYPVLDRRSGVRKLLQLWGTVLVGNLIGAFLGALLLVGADGVVGAGAGYVAVGRHLTHPDAVPLLASAALAGCLMALGAWLIHATPPEVTQIVVIYIVTFLIGIGQLHHSIAGSVELFAAMLAGSDAVTWGRAVRTVALAVLGNLLGGSILVALLNYGHIRESRGDGER
jgi:formate/nitrite transporter FocA (FNT family)